MKRVIILFGLLWLILFSMAGIFIQFQQQAIHAKMELDLHAGNLQQYLTAKSNCDSIDEAVEGAASLSILALIIGLILSERRLPERYNKIIGLFLIPGVVLATLFKWLDNIPLMVMGNALIAVALLLTLVWIAETE